MPGDEGVRQGRSDRRSWFDIVNTILILFATIAAAVAAWFAASYTGTLTELERRRFSEIDIISLLSRSREKIEISFGKRSAQDRYILRITSNSKEDIQHLAIFVRALMKDHESGEKSEVELASRFESFLYPSDRPYEWNLTQQVRSNLQIYQLEPRSGRMIGFIVLAEWDTGLSQPQISRLSSRKFFSAW